MLLEIGNGQLFLVLLLGHQNRIAIVNGYYAIESIQIDDRRNEFIGDALYAVTDRNEDPVMTVTD